MIPIVETLIDVSSIHAILLLGQQIITLVITNLHLFRIAGKNELIIVSIFSAAALLSIPVNRALWSWPHKTPTDLDSLTQFFKSYMQENALKKKQEGVVRRRASL